MIIDRTTKNIAGWIEAFLGDRKAIGLSPHTVAFYRQRLRLLTDYTDSVGLHYMDQLDADSIRAWLIWLADTGHNPGGVHGCYRSLRVFLRWQMDEAGDERVSPLRKVKPPRVDVQPINPPDIDEVQKLISTCDRTLIGRRDRAIFTLLLDTGLRASELIALDTGSLDLMSGRLYIAKTKSRKPRIVYAGSGTRKAVRAYLQARDDDHAALFVTDDGERLTYDGLRQMLRRRMGRAGLAGIELHDFRRLFALTFLRNGGDIYSLQRLGGWSDLAVVRRYLAQTDADLAEAHRRASPVDNLL